MKLKIVVKQGRGGRWRWYFVDDDEKADFRYYKGNTIALCAGSFVSFEDAFHAARAVAQAEFDFNQDTTVPKRPWYSWLFGR